MTEEQNDMWYKYTQGYANSRQYISNKLKFICYSSTKNKCKLEFAYHLWLPFLDQPQFDILVFEMINYQIYNIMETEWKHGIGPNDIITFNEELEFLLTSIIEIFNIDEYSHEEAIVIIIKNKDLKMTEENSVTEDDNGNWFEW